MSNAANSLLGKPKNQFMSNKSYGLFLFFVWQNKISNILMGFSKWCRHLDDHYSTHNGGHKQNVPKVLPTHKHGQ